ncbi:hypothetical protein BKA70DRAFT_1109707 [Coprinopsis sp. MPI-PUGE-AT-0042]|nr:hypothetical protein BKA70DRAFT_1109707 [Coprinopsis sp. MPI-PUGE-AT-0042]
MGKAHIFDAASLASCSNDFGALAHGELDRRVSQLLLHFDLDPAPTLLFLRELGGYISGSAVLSIMDPGPWQPHDLDIYIPSASGDRLRRFLVNQGRFGFVFERGVNLQRRRGSRRRARRHSYSRIPGLGRIWYFRSLRGGRVVNVMLTTTTSALMSIVAFHSTVVMNFITYFGLVSLYGDLTRARLGWSNLDGNSQSKRDQLWMEKYRKRGYHIFDDSSLRGLCPHQCGTNHHCTQSERSLHDAAVKVVKFSQFRDHESPPLLASLEEVFVWRLKNQRCKPNSTACLKGFVHNRGNHLCI